MIYAIKIPRRYIFRGRQIEQIGEVGRVLVKRGYSSALVPYCGSKEWWTFETETPLDDETSGLLKNVTGDQLIQCEENIIDRARRENRRNRMLAERSRA